MKSEFDKNDYNSPEILEQDELYKDKKFLETLRDEINESLKLYNTTIEGFKVEKKYSENYVFFVAIMFFIIGFIVPFIWL